MENNEKEVNINKILWGGILLLVIILFVMFQFNSQNPLKTANNNEISSNNNLNIVVNDFGDPVLGNPNGPVEIYEFSDFSCPFCKQVSPVVREVLEKYSDVVKFVYKDFPLKDIHPQAEKAAMAAQCAHEQGKWLDYHDWLFANQGLHDVENLKLFATEVGLNRTQFDECLDTGKYIQEVNADLREGINIGIEATPTFVINGKKLEGAITFSQMENIIKQVLEK